MTNHNYCGQYKDIANTAMHFGSNMGATQSYVDAVLKKTAIDPKNPTDSELEATITKACNWFLAMVLILHSDP